MTQEFPLNHFLKIDNNNKFDLVQPEERDSSGLNGSPNIENYVDDSEIKWLNDEICNNLNKIIGTEKFQMYFGNSFKLVSMADQNFVFSVPTQSIKNMLEKFYAGAINQSLFLILGREVNWTLGAESGQTDSTSYNSSHEEEALPLTKVNHAKDVTFSLDLDPSEDDKENEIKSKYLKHIDEENFGYYINKKKTFENFIVGPSNNMAYASAVAAADKPGITYPSVYFYSASGLGKSHLLHAIANKILEKDPTMNVCLTNAQTFMDEMVEAIRQKKTDEFKNKYTEKVDVLMIDDIHELKNKPGTQNAFFHIFNALHQKGKQLVFTSDKTPKEIDGVEERIITRLSWGLVQDISKPDLETRIAILKKKAIEEDIYLPDDVVTLIASCFKSNIRELEGSLIKLGAYASIMQVDVDVEIARQELKLDEYKEKSKPTLESITKAVSSYFKIPVGDLKGSSRQKDIATARHVSMYFCHKVLGETLVSIGKFFGNRDHTTVMHAVRRIETTLKEDRILNAKITELELQF